MTLAELRAQYRTQKTRSRNAPRHPWRAKTQPPRGFTPEETARATAARTARAQSRWLSVVALSDRGAEVATAAAAVGLDPKQFRKYVRRHHGDWQWPLCN